MTMLLGSLNQWSSKLNVFMIITKVDQYDKLYAGTYAHSCVYQYVLCIAIYITVVAYWVAIYK